MGNGIDEPENATHKRCSCKEQIKSSTCLPLRVSTPGHLLCQSQGQRREPGEAGATGTPRAQCSGRITRTERDAVWRGDWYENGKQILQLLSLTFQREGNREGGGGPRTPERSPSASFQEDNSLAVYFSLFMGSGVKCSPNQKPSLPTPKPRLRKPSMSLCHRGYMGPFLEMDET